MYRVVLLFLWSAHLQSVEGWITACSRKRTHLCLGEKPSANEAEQLRAQAQELRDRVASLEQEKTIVRNQERNVQEVEIQEKQALLERYSAVVPILKPDGNNVDERVSFPPLLKDSFITTAEANLPVGIILGESEDFAGTTVIDEIAEGSNGEEAGLQVGDIVRALIAFKVEMNLPTWQVLAGGIGQPKLRRFVYSADGKPIEEVLEAVASNRQDPEQRPVLFVVERRKK